MKTKIILFLSIILLLTGCITSSLTQKDLESFSIKGNDIMYNDTVVAKYTHLEYEYYKNKKTIEICLDQIELGYILGVSRYGNSFLDDFDYDDDDEETAKILESLKKKRKAEAIKNIVDKYFLDLELFGDRIVHLINMRHNMYTFSQIFSPFVLYVTPQCGEHRHHQLIIDKFSEINKGYCGEEEDEDY